MKKLIIKCRILLLLIVCSMVFAVLDFEMGFKPGILEFENSLVQSHFTQDFYWQMFLGVIQDNGWEVRSNLGRYTNVSNHPLEISKDLTIDTTLLYVSLIYNFNQHSFIQPFFGGGVGMYFFEFSDNEFGQLESGSRFGPHIISGVKFNFSESLKFYLEYSQHFVPKILFENADNFNQRVFTLGLGINLNEKNSANNLAYPYNRYEEELLLQIQQLQREIVEMRKEKNYLQPEVDEFYLKNDFKENDAVFLEEYQRIKFNESKVNVLDKQISKALEDLNNLERNWAIIKEDGRNIQEHIFYIENHYYASPYRVYSDNGYLVRREDSFYDYRYYQKPLYLGPVIMPKPPTPEERNEFVEKKQQRLKELKNRR